MFAGSFARKASTSPPAARPEDLLEILFPFHPPDRRGVWQNGPFLLAHGLVFNTPESAREETPLVCPESGLALASWARLDNREDLGRELDLRRPLEETTDPQLILLAYRKWGVDCPQRLLGDFAFVVFDPAKKSAFLARDPLGVRPLSYRLEDGFLRFAVSLSVFAHAPGWESDKNPDWMARYLIQHSYDPRTTPYRRVFKLPPGHRLLVGEEKDRMESYFHFRDDPPPARRRSAEWVEAYREAFEEAVRCRMRSAFPLGTENSGGLDSAGITACLAHLLGRPGRRLFSFGFAHAEQEPAFILETSRAKRITHNYIVTAGDPEDDFVPRGLAALGCPVEHGNGTAHIPFYRECELHGIRTLFSGFGGDDQFQPSPSLGAVRRPRRPWFVEYPAGQWGIPSFRTTSRPRRSKVRRHAGPARKHTQRNQR